MDLYWKRESTFICGAKSGFNATNVVLKKADVLKLQFNCKKYYILSLWAERPQERIKTQMRKPIAKLIKQK